MKNAILQSAAVALTMMAPAALAQGFSFDGAELSFRVQQDGVIDQTQDLRASAEGSFGQFGGQLDLHQFSYGSSPAYRGATLHLFYEPVDGLAVGAFATRDDWTGTPWVGAGAEARFETGAFSFEGAFGEYREQGTSLPPIRFVDLDAAYDFGNGFSALVNVSRTQDLVSIQGTGVGIRYEGANFFVEGTYTNLDGDYDYNVLGLEVGYLFGGGTTFQSRDSQSFLWTY